MLAGGNLTLVQRNWRADGLEPHCICTFNLSHDPTFAAKATTSLASMVIRRLIPLVLSVDETSRVQLIIRTQLGQRMKKWWTGIMAEDHKPCGATTLFAPFSVLKRRRLRKAFIPPLNAAAREDPGRQDRPRHPRQLCRPQALFGEG
jgi:hypothetical protein